MATITGWCEVDGVGGIAFAFVLSASALFREALDVVQYTEVDAVNDGV